MFRTFCEQHFYNDFWIKSEDFVEIFWTLRCLIRRFELNSVVIIVYIWTKNASNKGDLWLNLWTTLIWTVAVVKRYLLSPTLINSRLTPWLIWYHLPLRQNLTLIFMELQWLCTILSSVSCTLYRAYVFYPAMGVSRCYCGRRPWNNHCTAAYTVPPWPTCWRHIRFCGLVTVPTPYRRSGYTYFLPFYTTIGRRPLYWT